MATEAPKNTPDITCDWYNSQLPVWTFLQDLLDGQDAVKAKTTTYLPMEAAESTTDYMNRLARSLFPEDYRDCVVNLTGMVCRKPPKLQTDVPVEIRGLEEVKDEDGNVTQQPKEGLAENIDNAGTHINVFLQRVFQEAFFGHTFIVVDMPPRPEDVQTAQDEIANGGRSYWVQRKIIDTLNWRTALVNGRTILTQITFQECTKEADGDFGEVDVTRWRVYRLNEEGNAEWQIWARTTVDNQEVITMTSSGVILTKKGQPLKRLPVAVHYGEYEGFLQSRPPLKTIADINLHYYQKDSDLSNIEHYTCAPTLVITGGDDQKTDFVMGGNRAIFLPTGATAAFLEVEGKSIEHLEKDLASLEKRMVHKGLDFVREEHRVPTTATEVTLSFLERTSKLARMARSLKDCAEDALAITAEMEGLGQGGSIQLGIKESSLSVSAEQIDKYSIMNERGQLSRETFWEILQNLDLLPDNFDPTVETGRLKEAALEQMELNAKQFDSGLESTP